MQNGQENAASYRPDELVLIYTGTQGWDYGQSNKPRQNHPPTKKKYRMMILKWSQFVSV